MPHATAMVQWPCRKLCQCRPAMGMSRRSRCRLNATLACHAVDRKLVGPSFKDVAAKHQGQAQALDAVAARIQSGGSGMYGPVPMPAQPQLKDNELKLLAGWILAGAPDK